MYTFYVGRRGDDAEDARLISSIKEQLQRGFDNVLRSFISQQKARLNALTSRLATLNKAVECEGDPSVKCNCCASGGVLIRDGGSLSYFIMNILSTYDNLFKFVEVTNTGKTVSGLVQYDGENFIRYTSGSFGPIVNARMVTDLTLDDLTALNIPTVRRVQVSYPSGIDESNIVSFPTIKVTDVVPELRIYIPIADDKPSPIVQEHTILNGYDYLREFGVNLGNVLTGL